MPHLSREEFDHQLDMAKRVGYEAGLINGKEASDKALDSKLKLAQADMLKAAGQAMEAIARSIMYMTGGK